MSESLHGNDDLIIRYLDGEMNPGEKEDFLNRLAIDQELSEQLEHMQLAVDTVRLYGIKQKVSSIHEEMRGEVVPKESIGRIFSIRKWARYGISVAACILLVYLSIQAYKFYRLSSDSLYNETFIGYDISSSRGGSDREAGIERSYADRDFQAVIRQGTNNKSLTDRETFLTALSFMQTNDIPSSIQWFTRLNNYENPYRRDAEFYLALSYLKNKEYDKVIGLLEKINSDPSHPYGELVTKRLIRRVEMLKWKE